MNKRSFLILAAAVVFMVLLYWRDHITSVENIPVLPTKRETIKDGSQVAIAAEMGTQAPTSDQPVNAFTSGVPVQTNSDLDAQKHFSNALKAIANCFDINASTVPDAAEPTVTSVLEVLKPALGEMVVYYDDWDETVVSYPDGTRKRFRTEVSYEDVSKPTRYLMVYKLNPNGPPEMEDLDQQKTTNPNQDYIDSLKAGSNFGSEEKGGRAFFQDGEEMVVVEKNGQVDSISLTKRNKMLTCSDLTAPNGGCLCQQ